jgi:hypothetical protein
LILQAWIFILNVIFHGVDFILLDFLHNPDTSLSINQYLVFSDLNAMGGTDGRENWELLNM